MQYYGGRMSVQIVHLDWAIKTILRDKANFGILEGFLSALLEEDVEIIELLESESNQEAEKHKFNRVDLLVKGIDDIRYIIEVQSEYEYDYLERLLYGTSKTLVENLKLGEPYGNIKKIISVSILFYNLGRGDDYLYKGVTEFIGMTTGKKLKISRKEMVDEIKYKFVEKNIFPEYYLIQTQKFPDKVNKDIDEWIYAFKNNEVKDEFKSKHIELLREKLNILNMNEKERKSHERHVMELVIEKDMIGSAYRKGYIEADKKNKAKLEKERKEKEKALKEKEKAQKALFDTVKLLFSMNTDIKKISEVTGLSEKEIKKLLKASK